MDEDIDSIYEDGLMEHNEHELTDLPLPSYNEEENEITEQDVHDNVVSPKTYMKYCWEIYSFLAWCGDNQKHYLTQHGLEAREALSKQQHETRTTHRRRIEVSLKDLLREAETTPIFKIDLIEPRVYLSYLLQIKAINKRHGDTTRRYLSQSSYGTKRASLNHLFRLHNGTGYSTEFGLKLTNHCKGFYRVLTQRKKGRKHRNRIQFAEGSAINHNEEFSIAASTYATNTTTNTTTTNQRTIQVCWSDDEAKRPISVALYQQLCEWLLEYNTSNGVFAHCFLVLTWNLCCRSENTALIKLSDVVWKDTFDCYQVFFSHSKTDQLGRHSKYPRHMYSNTTKPAVCPILALSLYLTCCFNSCGESLDASSFLFLGGEQQHRFSKIMQKLTQEKEDEIKRFGYELNDLGIHSIRKGAHSYLNHLPGGPSHASTLMRGGWSLGNTQQRYIKYVEVGDQFVGRCLALNPVLSVEIAASPPFFNVVSGSTDDTWVSDTASEQFSAIKSIPGYGQLLRMCLASILYQRNWITNHLNVNHVVFNSSVALRSKSVCEKLKEKPDLLMVTYPWTDEVHTFSGVPPHIGLLNEVKTIRTEQSDFISNFVVHVKDAMESYGVNGDCLTERRLREIISDILSGIIQKNATNLAVNVETNNEMYENIMNNEANSDREVYQLHLYKSSDPMTKGQMIFHRVPEDWRFPRVGIRDIWRQWWLGNTIRQIPPLNSLTKNDVKHLRYVALDESELHGRTGKFKENRRDPVKTLYDLRSLCNFIEKKVVEAGAYEEIKTIQSVDRMFQSVESFFNVKDTRDVQKNWLSYVRVIRAQKITKR